MMRFRRSFGTASVSLTHALSRRLPLLLLCSFGLLAQAQTQAQAQDKPSAGGDGGGAQRKPIPIAKIDRKTPVDFEKEILPILKNNCLACHNKTTTKADLVLETPQD